MNKIKKLFSCPYFSLAQLAIMFGCFKIFIFIFDYRIGDTIINGIMLFAIVGVLLWSLQKILNKHKLILLPLFLWSFSILSLWLIQFLIMKMMKNNFPLELIQLISTESICGLIRYHLSIAICGIIISIILSVFLVWISRKLYPQWKFPTISEGIVFVLLVFFAGLAVWMHSMLPIRRFFAEISTKNGVMSSAEIKKHGIDGVDFSDLQIKAIPGKNLVHIIMESTEQNFLNEDEFPKLLPHLKKISEQGIRFDFMDMSPNAVLTFGGIYAAFTGSNLTILHLQRSISKSRLAVGNRLCTLPKVLHKAGYEQHFLYGHNSSFQCFNEFLEQNHFKIFMINDIKSRKPGYQDAVSDSDLFEYAWQHFQNLAEKKKPFSLTLLTIDAHPPDGICPHDKRKYRWKTKETPQLLHALHNTDKSLGEFISRLQKHPVWNDTILVIHSDHLAHPYMPENVLDALERSGKRKMLFSISNSFYGQGKKSIPSRTCDIAPTVLSAMQVKHNAKFMLGRNLFSGPDPTRFHDDTLQQKALTCAMLINSDLHFNVQKSGISFQEKPFPAVYIGKKKIALRAVDSLSNDIPRNNECYLLVFQPELDDCELQGFSTFEELQKHISSSMDAYLIFGHDAQNDEFYFSLVSAGKKIEKKHDNFSFPGFTGKELQQMNISYE